MILLIFGLLGVSLGIFMLCATGDDNDSYTLRYAMLCVIGGALLGVSIEKSKQEKVPTALDVYRNKTELKITSVNGVPTDSAVVFKNKEK